MNKTFTRKLIAAIMVFMILFSHSAFTMEAIASSGDFKVISVGLFSTDVIKYSVYPDGGKEKDDEIISDVNNHALLTIDLNPKVDGYLRDGTIRAVDLEGNELGFKIVNVTAVSETKTETAVNVAETEEDVTRIDVEEMLDVQETPAVVTEEEPSETVEEPTVVVPEKVENAVNTVTENTVNTVTENTVNTVNQEVVNSVNENTVSNETTNSTLKLETQGRKLTLETEQTVTSGGSASFGVLDEGKNFEPTEASLIAQNEVVEEEEPAVVAPNTEIEEGGLVDEEKLIESKSEQESKKDLSLTADVKVISDNEISIKNVISNTKLTVEIEYVQREQMTTRDAFKDVAFQLSGTFINEDLKEVEVGKEETLKIGWIQNKDIELSSEYTKVSPFEIGEKLGTIVESTVKVKRESKGNYLPIVSSTINVDIPEFKGKLPTDVTVYASKLLLTRGEDIGSVRFDITNWKVDGNKLTIQVDNDIDGLHKVGNGEDEYVIVYRYEDYTEDITSRLGQNVTATLVQLNAKENSTYIKNVSQEQEIKIDANELVTYSVNSSEEKIEKAKIYANYNNDQAIYDTEYTTEVNVNVLTSDLLKELKIQDYKEYYKDVNGNLFRAEGIIYKRIKFNYSDLKNILSNGGGIEIYNQDGVLLYTLVSDLVNDEEDAIVEVNSLGGCYIVAKGIATNGRINFEITKAIMKCNYEKAAFKNFTQMESVINAEIKYEGIEEAVKLESKKTSKLFDESYTKANLVINKPTLTTLQTNEDVEVKIELNNDKENSDLYVNPVFELVFPKYVQEVTVESINLLFNNGLTIGNVERYTEDGLVKLRVALNGAQTTFSDSKLSNGTNLLLNLNVKVDEYTPAKEDQIKLFYYNEGAANYQAQTKWKLSRIVPNGLLKTTNGFDVALIKYQAPSGLVAINGIINYDGQNSELTSVKKGKVTAEVGIGEDSRIATMELLALNNTENECSDVILLGRIPYIGNKAVITGEDLETTVNAVMLEELEENVQNPNTSDIYYSTNGNANNDLDDPSNGWTKYPTNFNEVRSFIIVVKGNLLPGAVQRYTYNFEIPANLAYSTSIAGSFGAYYTDVTDVGEMEQTSQADTVAITTKDAPKVTATLFVKEGEGTEVKEADYLTYVAMVENQGGIDAEGTTVTIKKPDNGKFLVYYEQGGADYFCQYKTIQDKEKVIDFGTVKAGESKTQEFMIKVDSNSKPDDTSNWNLKVDGTLKVSNLKINTNTNSLVNPITEGFIDASCMLSLSEIRVRRIVRYNFSIKNIAENMEGDFIVETQIPKEMKFFKLDSISEDKYKSFDYDEATNKVTMNLGNIVKNGVRSYTLEIQAINATEENSMVSVDSIVRVNNVEKKILSIAKPIYGGLLEAELVQQPSSNTVLEKEDVAYVLKVKNIGTKSLSNVLVKLNASPNYENVRMTQLDGDNSNFSLVNDNHEAAIYLPSIEKNIAYNIEIKGKAAELNGQEKTIENGISVLVDDEVQSELNTNTIYIKANPNKQEEKPINLGTTYNQSTEKKTQNSATQANTNNNQTTQKPNTNTYSNTNNTNNTDNNIQTYSISGTAWLDANKDGVRDGEEKELSGVEVQLLSGRTMIKVTTTDKSGNYTFTGVPNGKYTVVFNYDGEKYTTTKYNKENVDSAFTSNVIESKAGKALTDEIKVEGGSVGYINLGLQIKDTFDLAITKLATRGTITMGSKVEEYKFDDAQLAKLEIQSKKIKGSVVELTYKIVVENKGNIDGFASKIEDYIPDEMKFNPEQNPGWNLGTDGILYNETLKDQIIKVGEKKELKLVLTKEMNEENTGVSSNKVKISELNNEKGLSDINENNVNTQETLILIKTGYTPQIAAVLFFMLLAATVVGVKYKEKIANIFSKKVIR